MTHKANALDVSRYICDFQTMDASLNISHLKLQKLVFYCQAFHLAINDKPLFSEDVKAWALGPVVEEVYHEYKLYGNSIIPSTETPEDDIETNLSGDEIATVSAVLSAYGHLSATALVEKTHRETPWKEAFKKGRGTIIEQDVMRSYYKEFLTDEEEDEEEN